MSNREQVCRDVREQVYRDRVERELKTLWGNKYEKHVSNAATILSRICNKGEPGALLGTETNGHLVGNDIDFLKACAQLGNNIVVRSMISSEEVYRKLVKRFCDRPEILAALDREIIKTLRAAA